MKIRIESVLNASGEISVKELIKFTDTVKSLVERDREFFYVKCPGDRIYYEDEDNGV